MRHDHDQLSDPRATVKTLSSKGQIVVPKEIRVSLGVKPGDKVTLRVQGESITLAPAPRRAEARRRRGGESLDTR